LVSGADFVIASTPYLANYYKQYNANISVWDGPLDVDDIRTNIKKSINYSRPKIGWFGTMLNLPILKELNIKKDITTITTGGDIEWRKETIDKEIQKFDLVCLPQRHNPQGFSKTNCRMLKSLYLGVPVLASSIPSYIELANFLDYPSELILGENDDWNERIEKIIIGEIKINLDFSKIRKLILSRYSIQNSVEKWLQLINSFHKEPRTSFFGKLKQRKDLIKDGINQCYINLTRNLIFKK
ncbi:MAG: glycosyltransferase, partial [Desulfovibrio sp.]|nr:glycosyltransferase [Desulfovibrio sp.]